MPIAWWSRLNANYHSTKLILFYALGGLCWLGVSGKIKLPRLSNLMLFSVTTILTIIICKHFYQFRYDNFLYFSRILCFWGVVLYFYNSKLTIDDLLKKTSPLILLTTTSILIICLLELYQLRVVGMSKSLNFLGTFGNVNMMSEFFILSVPFIYHWMKLTEKMPQFVKLTVYIFWIFFIFFLRSRSVWIGLGFFFVLLLWYKGKKKDWAGVLVALLLYLIFQWAPSMPDNVSNIKDFNTQARAELYKASVQMIKDHPLGIEVGKFIGTFNPYLYATGFKLSERHFYDNPHSDFLKWGIYYGWLFILSVTIFLLVVAWQIFNWIRSKENFILVVSFFVLMPQFAFQFPFENPASTAMVGLILGLFFKKFKTQDEFFVNKKLKAVFVIFSSITLFSGYAFLYSIYNESRYPKNENIIQACAIYPIYNKACHAKMVYYIEKQKLLEFIRDFKEIIYRQPTYIDFIKLTPTFYSFQSNSKKTCEALFFYRSLYPEHEAFQPAYYDACAGFSDPFYFDNPKAFTDRYMNWLSDID